VAAIIVVSTMAAVVDRIFLTVVCDIADTPMSLRGC